MIDIQRAILDLDPGGVVLAGVEFRPRAAGSSPTASKS
jgi:hypothetical protein